MKPWLTFLAAGLLSAAALRAEDPPSTVITSAGPMETVTKDTETTTTFHDQVEVTDAGLRLTSDFLQVVADSRGNHPGASGPPAAFKSMVATGHVTIYRGDQVVTCGRAEISENQDKIVLSDNPLLRRPKDNFSHTPGPHGQIIYHRGQQEGESVSAPGEHGRTVLPTIRDMGLESGGKTPAPPAPAPAP